MRTPATRSLFLGAVIAAGSSLSAQSFPTVPVPSGNPITSDKVLLGKALFWDEQLSFTGTVACGTCHIPSAGGTDPRVQFSLTLEGGTVNPGPDGVFGTGDDRIGSPGVPRNNLDGTYQASAWGLAPQITGRKAPSMINAAFHKSLFWDGRAAEQFVDPADGTTEVLRTKAALESQAAGPPVSDVEMGHFGISWLEIPSKIAAARPLALASNIPAPLASFIAGRTYPQLFQLAFGTSDVTAARIAMAIATYERTLISADSPFDRYANGANPQELTEAQVRGLQVFNGPGQCNTCHPAPAFTNDNFHDLGVRPDAEDPGKGGVTGSNGDLGKFKTTGLRNIALHRHFMHNGMFTTLAEVVEFYDRGGDFPGAQISVLNLTAQQKSDLVAFLHALTDERVRDELPPFDRPTLYSESPRVPAGYGNGTAGSGGFAPDSVAIEPPFVGNPNWTVGLQRGLGGAPAILMLDAVAAPGAGFPFLGVQVLLGASPALTPVGIVPLSGTGAGDGWGSLVLSIPSAPALAGGSLYLQWLAFDAGGPLGLTASEGTAVTFF